MKPVFAPKPLVLDGRVVRLEPLAARHAPDLFLASQQPEIWRWMPIPMFAAVSEVEAWIAAAQAGQAAGTDVPFATVRRTDGRAIGSTRFLDIRVPHRAVEIGWTWLTPTAQRTGINTEAKFLMLCHLFEQHGAVRVQLKTDELNQQSRKAIGRLGATFEGILRNFQTRAHDGYVRNTAMFSITDKEWPAVKRNLEAKMDHRSTASAVPFRTV